MIELEFDSAAALDGAAARIALVALHGALADVLPRDWNGPYVVTDRRAALANAFHAAEYLASIGDKPVRIEAYWQPGIVELESSSLLTGPNAGADLHDWTSFQRTSAQGFIGRLAFSGVHASVPISGGDAVTYATAEAILRFFLSYDLLNAYVLTFDRQIDDAPLEERRYRGLRFAPNRKQSTIQLSDLA